MAGHVQATPSFAHGLEDADAAQASLRSLRKLGCERGHNIILGDANWYQTALRGIPSAMR